MKRIILLFVLAFVLNKAYSQQESHTIFDKDSLVSVTNHFDKFKTIDSLIIKTNKRTLVITEKDVIPFYQVIDENERLGICPFATEIQFLNKRLILVAAIFRTSFSTSFYIFFINRKTCEIITIIKTESPKKGLNTLSVILIKNKLFIPKKANFISSDTIKIMNKKRKSINIKTTSSKYIKPLLLGNSKNELEKETYFEIPIK